MDIYYNPDYTASEYSFDTTRKATLIAEAAQQRLGDAVQIVSPEQFYQETEDWIRLTHSSEYVDAVKTGKPRHLAESQGFKWDEKFYSMVVAHNAGVVAAMHDAIYDNKTSITLSSGLHHARKDYGSGFCTFNGLAVATNYALNQGVKNILIIDFDAHGGGGTYSLVGGKVTHVDLITSPFDVADEHDGRSLIIVSETDDETYLANAEALLAFGTTFHHQVAIYNAGMDPYNSGVSKEALIAREEMVANTLGQMGIPTVVTMAGGYKSGKVITMQDIADLHVSTIEQFALVGANR